MKKFLSILLAAMMVLATAGVAFAEGEGETTTPATPTTYTITIKGDDGHTYEAYQIFGGELSDNGSVLSNIVWGDGLSADGQTAALSFDKPAEGAEGADAYKPYADAAALAEALTDDNIDLLIATIETKLGVKAGTFTSETVEEGTGENKKTVTQYTISGLEPGYYFIKDQDASLDGQPHGYTKYMLKVVKSVNVTPKTDKTVLEKKVKENVKYTENATSANGYTYGAGYNDVADYNIGDKVPFSLYSKVPVLTNFDHYEMTFHDQMSAGLTLDEDSIKVFVGSSELKKDADYEVITSTSDKCTFEVKIGELVGKNYAAGATIRVDFDATLNEKAVIGLDGNPNQAKLEFTNNPNNTETTTETPWDYVVVFTYELDVTKIDGADPDKKLEGAEFLMKNTAGSYLKVTDAGYITWVASEDDATVLASDENGIFSVVGLDDGTYTLIEKTAPDGYNKLSGDITIVISATNAKRHEYIGYNNGVSAADTALTALTIKIDNEEAVDGDLAEGTVSATIENNSGATLPETGGIGTTLFYLIGGLMAAGSALTLVIRRRADADEE